MSGQLWVCGLMLAVAARADMSERLTMAVSPAQSFAPTTLTVRVRVKPDAENRALEVVAESSDYYRSSHIQLDGKEAPHTIAVELRSLPGGHYEVRATLIDEYGHTRALVRSPVIVIGSTDDTEYTATSDRTQNPCRQDRTQTGTTANGLRELDDNPPARSASYSWLPVYFYFLSAGRRSSQGLETSAAGFPVDCVAARQPIAARRVQFGSEYFMGAAD